MRAAALSVLLPEMTVRCMMDQTRAGGFLRLECAKLQCSFSVDMQALFTLVNGVGTRPLINTPQGESVQLFPSGSVPVVHFHDPCCPYMLPASSPNIPGPGSARSWAHTVSAEPIEKLVPTTTTVLTLPLIPRSLPIATGNDTTKFPGEFRTRPLARVRNASAKTEYIWIDANQAAQSDVTILLDVTFFCTGALTTEEVSAVFVTYLLANDGEEAETIVPAVVAGLTSIGTNKWQAALTVVNVVPISGWYRFAINMGFPTILVGAVYTQLNVKGDVLVGEYPRFGCGFFVDPTYTSMTALALRYWPGGSSSLASYRSPVLTGGGTAYGLNYKPWKDWIEPVSVGDANARAFAPVHEQANGQQGYRLTDGMYVWERTSVVPDALLDVSADLPYTSNSTVVERPPIAYLIGASGAFDGGSIMFFDPSASATGSTAVMKFQSTNLFAYQPRSKIINPTSFPLTLLPDEHNALLQAIAFVPNFSENDWHSAFSKFANVAFQVAKYVVQVGGALHGNPVDAIQTFIDIKDAWINRRVPTKHTVVPVG